MPYVVVKTKEQLESEGWEQHPDTRVYGKIIGENESETYYNLYPLYFQFFGKRIYVERVNFIKGRSLWLHEIEGAMQGMNRVYLPDEAIWTETQMLKNVIDKL